MRRRSLRSLSLFRILWFGLLPAAVWLLPLRAQDAATAAEAKSSKSAAPAPGVKAASSVVAIPTGVALQPPPAGFDVEARSQQVLAHLSSVIRYYGASVTPIQKVGEPSDELYRDQAVAGAKQIADYAFQSGKAEADLLVAYQNQKKGQQAQAAPSGEVSEAERLQAAKVNAARRMEDLKAQQQQIENQLARARPKQVEALRTQKEQVDGEIALSAAMSEALDRIVSMSDLQGRAGLAADIERLQRTAPGLADSKASAAPVPLDSFAAAESAGVSSQAIVVIQLLTTRRDIDQLLQETDALHQQALSLRTPLTNIVRGLVQKGQELSQQQPASDAEPSAAEIQETRANFASVTATFKVLSSAAVPLSQEIITIEQSRANLLAWRTAVETEYRSVLRSLLLRILVIGIALSILLALGEVWRRVTTRYVHDLRRRRQLLGMRRMVVSVLSVLVVLFGFVTRFNSLATFAAFITAGLAVGLQTILLSVAAYFFIVGRYGVRVGDRITVATVTGDVIEVGLVRFYVMELAGSGTELQSTGRVAVFSNAILFQAGTPLYKQVPGTEYAWHELIAKLDQASDYGHAAKSIVDEVERVYETYRGRIEQQHEAVEGWMDVRIMAPTVESHLQLVDGLQLLVRFPVEISNAATIDAQITEGMLRLMAEDQAIKKSMTAPPAIRAAIKG